MSIFKDHILENKKKFPDEKVDRLIEIYQNMVKEVEELESMFPDRHFTLDGHLVGSMGEAIAANRYGIELKKASYADFDGTIYRHPVQIKIVQQDYVTIHYSGEKVPFEAYLLVLYMNKSGQFYEVYNGSMIRENVRRKWLFSAFSTFPNKNILKEDLFNGSNRLEWLCRRKVAERS